MHLHQLTEEQVIADLRITHGLFYLKRKKLTFAIHRTNNTLDWIITGKPTSTHGLVQVDSLLASYGLTRYAEADKTLYVDAHAITGLLTWAQKQKTKWRNKFSFTCFFENLFTSTSGMTLPNLVQVAMYATLGLEAPGEISYFKNQAIAQYPAEFAALARGEGKALGIIELDA